MITENEWGYLSKRVFPNKPAQAPAFLWTRVLASIEEQEQKRTRVWWAQVPWMTRVTAAVAIFVFLGAGITYYQSANSNVLDTMLQGQSEHAQVIHLSQNRPPNRSELTAWILEEKPWADD